MSEEKKEKLLINVKDGLNLKSEHEKTSPMRILLCQCRQEWSGAIRRDVEQN